MWERGWGTKQSGVKRANDCRNKPPEVFTSSLWKSMIARSRPNSDAVHGTTEIVASEDRELFRRLASGDDEALGGLIDRWGDRFYEVMDALKLPARDADHVIEEVFRRLAFDSSRFVSRPEKFREWVQRTCIECAGSVLARRSVIGKAAAVAHTESPAAMFPERSPTAVIFQSMLERGALADALGYLNAQTPFRFTAVYRFDGLLLENMWLFDRESGFGSDSSVAKVSDTYCVWIHETLSVVQMSDALTDPRAKGHPKREAVRSYCGGPIRDETGRLFGTICHFDFEPRAETREAMPILAEVGPLLARQICSIQEMGTH